MNEACCLDELSVEALKELERLGCVRKRVTLHRLGEPDVEIYEATAAGMALLNNRRRSER